MAVRITGAYEEGLRVRLRHGPSEAEIRTAAPVDNHGDGSSFSPTDLAAAALGACMLTVMGIAARREGISLEGAAFELEKHMCSDPRRIGSIPLVVRMPAGLPAARREMLERTALTCPVARSLHPDVETPVRFVYPD